MLQIDTNIEGIATYNSSSRAIDSSKLLIKIIQNQNHVKLLTRIDPRRNTKVPDEILMPIDSSHAKISPSSLRSLFHYKCINFVIFSPHSQDSLYKSCVTCDLWVATYGTPFETKIKYPRS